MTAEGSQSQQEKADEFHMMVGYCIAEWADVDNALFNIFQLCVGRREPSAIIYYRMTGLEQRICSFSWNRDPATGLIFIQSGPLG